MYTDQPPDQPCLPLPTDVDKRLSHWHSLWNRSASYHYFFGVVSVGASVISTSMEGNHAKVFSIIAAIATALIGFMHPERRYAKFVRAWRVLDIAAMRYRHGLCDKAALIEAVERGEALIAEFEDKVDLAPEQTDPEGAAGASALVTEACSGNATPHGSTRTREVSAAASAEPSGDATEPRPSSGIAP